MTWKPTSYGWEKSYASSGIETTATYSSASGSASGLASPSYAATTAFAGSDAWPETTSNYISYNVSSNGDYDEFATVVAVQEISGRDHFHVPATTVNAYADNDSYYAAVSNVSAISCVSHIPSAAEYLAAINIIGVTIFVLGALAVVIILYMYVDTLKHIIKYAPPLAKTHSAFVLSVYPVVAVATYCAIVVPRAHLLAEAMTQGMFMACLYQLFCLLVAYCGGEAELIRRVKPDSLVLKVPPCCCWPCCFCLPNIPVKKTNVKILRLLVLQLPVVQGLVYMVLLVMWAEEESLYQVNYMYMQPVIIISILCGIWGMIMTMTMLADVLKDHYIKGKFFALQFVLLLAKFQGLAARCAVWSNALPCKMPITPAVYANLIYNTSMLWEMIVLGAIARILYKRPVTDFAAKKLPPTTHMNCPQICSVITCDISEKYGGNIMSRMAYPKTFPRSDVP